MKKRRIFLSFAISLFFLYLIIWKPQISELFKGNIDIKDGLFGVTRIDFEQAWVYLQQAAILPLVICFLITPIHVLVRAHRWKLLIEPVDELKTKDSFSIQMLGYFANTIFPLRIGEVAKGFLLSRKTGLKISTSLATVVLERILDVISLLIIIAVLGLVYEFPESLREGAILLGLFSVIGLGGVVYYAMKRDPLSGLTGRILNIFPSFIADKLRKILLGFVKGFGMIRSVKRYPTVLMETCILWILYALQEYVVLIAFDIPAKFPLLGESPVMATFIILAVTAAILSIPSAPGGIGSFHAAVIFSLALFEVGVDTAAGYAFILHSITVGFYLIFGMVILWIEGLKLTELKEIGTDGINQG